MQRSIPPDGFSTFAIRMYAIYHKTKPMQPLPSLNTSGYISLSLDNTACHETSDILNPSASLRQPSSIPSRLDAHMQKENVAPLRMPASCINFFRICVVSAYQVRRSVGKSIMINEDHNLFFKSNLGQACIFVLKILPFFLSRAACKGHQLKYYIRIAVLH